MEVRERLAGDGDLRRVRRVLRELAARRSFDDPDIGQIAVRGAHLVDERGVRGVGEDHPGTGVPEHEFQVSTLIRRVHRHRDAAGLEDREPGDRPLHHVGQHDRDPVAGANPVLGDQSLRQARGPVVDLAEGPRPFREPKELTVGRAPGLVRQQADEGVDRRVHGHAIECDRTFRRN